MAEPIQLFSSAPSNAICLPEIVSTVLEVLYADYQDIKDRTILACARVAHLWEFEANRRLWQSCGEDPLRAHSPAIRHLLALSPERQQRYANHVRILTFSESQSRDNPRLRTKDGWEGCFRDQLTHLSFPSLQELCFRGPLNPYIPRTAYSPPARYLTPRLRSIECSNSRGPSYLVVSNEFLSQMARRCKRLQRICLGVKDDNHDVSRETLASLIQETPRLTDLTLGNGLSNLVSSQPFHILAHSPILHSLEIYNIEESWIEDLQLRALPPPSLFRSLKRLSCGISATVLSQLLPFLAGLEHLIIDARKGSTGIFNLIANAGLAHLKELCLQPCLDTTIYAADILHLAKCAPDLETLMIPHWGSAHNTYLPTVRPLDNETMDQIARQLPQLFKFRLLSELTALDETSLISLGTHCPHLCFCSMTVTIDATNLAATAPRDCFPNLSHLILVDPPVETFWGRPLPMPRRPINDAPAKLKSVMPALQRLEIDTSWAYND